MSPTLAELTTMRVGGPATRVVEAGSVQEIVDAVVAADAAQEPLLVLGGGSNLLVADAGFDGTVVRVTSRGVQVESEDLCGGVLVRVAAGEPWDDLVARAVHEGWSGIEALSGIPGSTGATPVQNVGAYGQDVSQTIWQVRVLDRVTGALRTLSNAECGFAYRHSILKESVGTDARGGPTPRYVVLEVLFQLRPTTLSQPLAYADLARGLGLAVGQRAPLGQVREAVLAQRRRRGMVLDTEDHDTWSCGSFFTNPVLAPQEMDRLRERVLQRCGPQVTAPEFPTPEGDVKTSAAWLIERAGFGRGHGLPGPAGLSTKHTLALTNRGAASAADLLRLAREVRDGVQEAFGVSLVNEPVLVGLSL